MGKFISKLIRQTKGMEALQAVILAAIAVILAVALKGIGDSGTSSTTKGTSSVFQKASGGASQ